MYAYRTTHGPVDLAFTDRLGGVSAVPWAELNLSLSGDDAESAKAENHRRLVEDFAPDVAEAGREQGTWGFFDAYQVHGSGVDLVDVRRGGRRPEADALVATGVTAPLLVRAADCVPVLFACAESGVVGAAHAGRKGVELGVALRTVEVMRDQGATAVHAWIGPHICGSCYEVPRQMQDEFAALVPGSATTTSWGTPAVDLGAGLTTQLEGVGVTVHHDGFRCTLESADLFSYRRDGVGAGRHAGIIRRRS